VTHSLCTLEFENNRELYDWVLDNVGFEEPRPHQYEFARLELEHTVLSKRRQFCEMIGVAKADSTVDMGKLEYAVRDTLNRSAPRGLAVLRPLKVVLTNWPSGKSEVLSAPRHPDLEGAARDVRDLHLGRELYIEADDFSMDPPAGWRRLAPGREVRLRYAYVIRCDEAVHDPATGEVVELRCTYDPDTLGRNPEGRRVAGTLHWVSAGGSVSAEVRLYDRLFKVPDPDDVPEGGDFTMHLNPDSRTVLTGARVEAALAGPDLPERLQFERLGYFAVDPDSSAGRPVFNRIVTLKDTWSARGRPDVGAEAPTGRPKDAAPAEAPAEAPAPRDRISDERRAARVADPELAARFERYRAELDLTLEDADVLTGTRALSDFYEVALATRAAPDAVASWVVNDLRSLVDGEALDALPFGGAALGRLAALVDEGVVSRRAAREVLAEMVARGGDPAEIVARRGLEKLDDPGALRPVVDEVLAAWPEKVAEYRAGNHNLLGLFMGQVMKGTGGTADPALARRLLLEALGGGA
jgi:glutaminyl-tRNA synthetase